MSRSAISFCVHGIVAFALNCTPLAAQTSKPTAPAADSLLATEVEAYRRLSLQEHLSAAIDKLGPDGDTAPELREIRSDIVAAAELIAPLQRRRPTVASVQASEPSAATSRLSLVTHLNCAHDAAMQTYAHWNTGTDATSAAAIEAMSKAIDLLARARDAALGQRGWLRHKCEDAPCSLEVPPHFTRRDNKRGWIAHFDAKDSHGVTDQVIYVRILPTLNVLPRDYLPERRVHATRRLDDALVVDEGRAHGTARDGFYEFVYTYRWRGDEVRAIVRGVATAYGVYEIQCLASAATFNRDTFDQVYESFRRTR